MFSIQSLPLDLIGLQYFLSQCLENSLSTELETQTLHPPDQPSLTMSSIRQTIRQDVPVPLEFRPSLEFMNVSHENIISASVAEITFVILRKDNRPISKMRKIASLF